jgi:SAM-dependent methyltransferase
VSDDMKDIIVFGHGRYYQFKKEQIKKKYNIIAFVDNVVKKNDVKYDGDIPIYNPIRLVKDLPEVPIITMSVKFFEMYKQIVQIGKGQIEESRILFGCTEQPYYNQLEKMLAEMNYKVILEQGRFLIIGDSEEYSFSNEIEYKEFLRILYRKYDPYIDVISKMPTEPISRNFAAERGKPLDRYYIEKFLEDNRQYICGDVMEIAETTYTDKFGINVAHSYALHVNGWGDGIIQGNLETGEGIQDNSIDCLICTQTIQFIYGIKEVVKNIYKLLKPGGHALVTAAGISYLSMYDYDNWGEYWKLTKYSMRKLFEESFDSENVEVCSYGNSKIAIGMMYGLCQEDVSEKDFEYCDEQFPVIVTVNVKK